MVRVVHVVRRYGGVTEPFIEQRVTAAGQEAELWYERLNGPFPGRSRHVSVPALNPGGFGDKLFHRIPSLAKLARSSYRAAERDARPDVIHAHYLTTAFIVGMATKRPLVVSTYGFDVTVIPRRRLWQEAIRQLAPRIGAVLVEGPHMRSVVTGLGMPDDLTEVIPIAAQLGDIPFRERRPRHDGIRLIICGRMVEKKGHDLALRAFAEIATHLPDSTLRLVGGGPLLPTLERLRDSLPVARSIEFLGPMSREDYLRQVARADVLLAPSRTARNGDAEGGAPTTILDAQAAGTIVVGSTHADIPFLVEEGRTGYLAEEGHVGSLADAILRAVSGTRDWPGIARRARLQVESRHSDELVARRLKDVHERVA